MKRALRETSWAYNPPLFRYGSEAGPSLTISSQSLTTIAMDGDGTKQGKAQNTCLRGFCLTKFPIGSEARTQLDHLCFWSFPHWTLWLFTFGLRGFWTLPLLLGASLSKKESNPCSPTLVGGVPPPSAVCAIRRLMLLIIESRMRFFFLFFKEWVLACQGTKNKRWVLAIIHESWTLLSTRV